MNSIKVAQAVVKLPKAASEYGVRNIPSSNGISFDIKQVASYIHLLLITRGPMAAEDITDACKEAGFVPPDDRAFGNAFRQLSMAGRIHVCGYCNRTKGHHTTGGKIWAAQG